MLTSKDYIKPTNWPTLLGFSALRVLSWLPLPVIAAAGTAIGTTLFFLVPSRRRIALRNVSACFPHLEPDEHKRIVKRCFQLISQTLLSIGINWWAPKSRLEELVTFVGREHYDRAVASGNNVILLAPHVIALEIAGLCLSWERPMISMYQRTKKPVFDAFVESGRSRFGGILVERKDPLRNLVKLINKGYPFYYLPDQDAGRKGIFVSFFGQQASTTPMLAKFAQITNAIVIPCSTRIKPRGRGWEVVIAPPLPSYPTRDDQQDTTIMNMAIEALIQDMPEQYFWVHKRFKTQPEDSPPFYP